MSPKSEKKHHRVIVFSTPTCPHCRAAKRYLEQHGIRYVEVDVSRDAAAARDPHAGARLARFDPEGAGHPQHRCALLSRRGISGGIDTAFRQLPLLALQHQHTQAHADNVQVGFRKRA